MELNKLQEKIYHKICDRIAVGKDFKVITDNIVVNFYYSKFDLEWNGYIYDNTKNWEKYIENGWIDVKIFLNDKDLKKYIKEII